MVVSAAISRGSEEVSAAVEGYAGVGIGAIGCEEVFSEGGEVCEGVSPMSDFIDRAIAGSAASWSGSEEVSAAVEGYACVGRAAIGSGFGSGEGGEVGDGVGPMSDFIDRAIAGSAALRSSPEEVAIAVEGHAGVGIAAIGSGSGSGEGGEVGDAEAGLGGCDGRGAQAGQGEKRENAACSSSRVIDLSDKNTIFLYNSRHETSFSLPDGKRG